MLRKSPINRDLSTAPHKKGVKNNTCYRSGDSPACAARAVRASHLSNGTVFSSEHLAPRKQEGERPDNLLLIYGNMYLASIQNNSTNPIPGEQYFSIELTSL